MFYLFIVQVINVEGRTSNCSGGRGKHFMSKERREKILKRLDKQKHHMTNTKTKTITTKHNDKGSKNSQYKNTGINSMAMLLL